MVRRYRHLLWNIGRPRAFKLLNSAKLASPVSVKPSAGSLRSLSTFITFRRTVAASVKRSDLLFSVADDEHRARRVSDNMGRGASQEHSLNWAESMSAQYRQIDVIAVNRMKDLLCGVPWNN